MDSSLQNNELVNGLHLIFVSFNNIRRRGVFSPITSLLFVISKESNIFEPSKCRLNGSKDFDRCKNITG